MDSARLVRGDQFVELTRTGSKVKTVTGPKPKKSKTLARKDEWDAKEAFDAALLRAIAEGFLVEAKGIAYAASKTDRALDKQVADDPSRATFEVYADWLQDNDDPRGKLAVAPYLKQPALALADRGRYYGPFAPFVAKPKKGRRLPVEARWNHGWIDRLTLNATSVWDDDLPTYRLAEIAPLVALLPEVTSARHVQVLTFGPPLTNDAFDYTPAVEALIANWPAALRKLRIGAFDTSDSEVSWATCAALPKLWKKAARLEGLVLKLGKDFTLGKIVAPALRWFSIETGGLSRAAFKSILAANWPNLESLVVWFGQEDYGCDVEPAHVAPLLAGKIALPKLTHLALANTTWGDELCALVAKSPFVKQLETLDLSGGHLTDAGVATLAASGNLAHIKVLDLSSCLIETPNKAAKLARKVVLGDQVDPSEYVEDGNRYSVLGE